MKSGQWPNVAVEAGSNPAEVMRRYDVKMTATDELRKLLDERGVEWWPMHDDEAGYRDDRDTEFLVYGCKHVAHEWGCRLQVDMLTPEQAIAATLGRGECKLRDCEGSFSAVNRPVWLCDCGAFVTQYTDATTYHKPRFCPNCGRSVKR